MKTNEVRDPIYGFIDFNDWEKEIIRHDAFQRLRRIRQLALTDLVYPGAMHTRFEHSLGVMHLATLMYNAIVNNDINRKRLEDSLCCIEAGIEKNRQLIRLAALLHDVGHAPFSHASDEIMPINSRTHKPYKHEDYTTAIIKGPLRTVIENNKINRNNFNITADEVASLIEVNPDNLGGFFWKVIISSQLDADRGDYLLRDSHHIGVKYGIYDHARLLNTLTLGEDPESEELVLGINEGGWHIAESIVIARYQMFTQVYFHKTRRAFDYHLEEAMKKILSKEKLPPPEELKTFMKLDDNAIWARIKKEHTDFNCQSILTRDQIREVYCTPETPTLLDEKELKKNMEKLERKNIWNYLDSAEKVWYKLNANKEEHNEIMIINEKGKTHPLSEDSSVVKNMNREIKQRRIYVKSKDKEEAKVVLNGK